MDLKAVIIALILAAAVVASKKRKKKLSPIRVIMISAVLGILFY